jgi:hypothetical protein
MKIVKPVSFNDGKENDKRMLEHVKRRNFSGYVKRLIQADILALEKNKGLTSENESVQEQVPKTAAERLKELKKKRP